MVNPAGLVQALLVVLFFFLELWEWANQAYKEAP